MNKSNDDKVAASYLLSAPAIRERCFQIYKLVENGEGLMFDLRLEHMDDLTEYVLSVIRSNYSNLIIPYHSRWRHIETGGKNRTSKLLEGSPSEKELACRKFDLVIISILLDAGAGEDWNYLEGNDSYSRSEGLAVASFQMFRTGLFSDDPSKPFQVNSSKLQSIQESDLAQGMQVTNNNFLLGLEGRLSLLNRLGEVTKSNPNIFGESGRLGNLILYLEDKAQNKKLSASDLLSEVLKIFTNIWPNRANFGGKNLGDTWSYPGIKGINDRDSFVPFHKLSQWLTYSLLEPLESIGIEVTNLQDLTGLPEYRNGGLFIDGDVLKFKKSYTAEKIYAPEDYEIVEWRALTVCLLDRIAKMIQERLPEAKNWSLANILEGGTWHAGRKLAKETRKDSGSPIKFKSDGTVF